MMQASCRRIYSYTGPDCFVTQQSLSLTITELSSIIYPLTTYFHLSDNTSQQQTPTIYHQVIHHSISPFPNTLKEVPALRANRFIAVVSYTMHCL